ncbi:MAG: sigma 54-interacting transcriptional regulator, partial [Rhodoferax sp.]|nr:sigma 54-interacting transcriptional regulator [Rhodoferax sp.]
SLIGHSPVFRQSLDTARRFAQTDLTVLISGESGVGKELFAQAIHSAGARAERPFVAVNCAAFPESLLESELFG